MLLDILGILIAFCSVMLMFSLIVTAFIQFLQNNLKWRTRHLKLGLDALAVYIYEAHCKNNWVSQEILSETFVDLMKPKIKANRAGLFYQLFRNYERAHVGHDEIKFALTKLHQQSDNQIKPELKLLLQEIDAFFVRIETEMSSHFARKTHFWSFMIAAVFVILFQLDTFSVLAKVSQDQAYREHLIKNVQQEIKAQKTICDGVITSVKFQQCLTQTEQKLALYDFTLLPKGEAHYYKVGETHHHKTLWQLISFWIGMVISTIFISLGAPFWFNRIKTLIQLKDKLSKVTVK
ncbi:hypothetical protein [Pseudoalteromonas denitrificans]|jgi:hypothetical protein|uniref:Uncharacterized protein n=1 Tax=Pseudoalteromonas denitrificans DSM 6059 TaxID=1123010 RepID=A0A1I1IE29_9GAMM|nr:hypothetical protein [Pseudoalteromonas denitrificans]SFC32488.1 hypothetical protein SAMN02745724_01429 [Pseudoalteromonas denitrificans DSM 6059]